MATVCNVAKHLVGGDFVGLNHRAPAAATICSRPAHYRNGYLSTTHFPRESIIALTQKSLTFPHDVQVKRCVHRNEKAT